MTKSLGCAARCGLPVTHDLAKIIVHGAREHNLKGICFEIPKGKLVGLIGPSGSGKSSIAVDVLQRECLRQYLESLGMTTDHIARAKVDHIMGLSPSIGVSQCVTEINPRSTIGTKTGILTVLRNLFAAMGQQLCIGCGEGVKQPLQDRNRLKVVEIEGDAASKKKTKSYFGCPHCGEQLEKLKMAHFSFNTTAGACKACKGLGEGVSVDTTKLLNEGKTLREGGVDFWDKGVAAYYEGVIKAASRHYHFPFDTTIPIRHYSKAQRDFLLYGVHFPDFVKAHKLSKPPKKVVEGRFEGLIPYLLNRCKGGELPRELKSYFMHELCHTCCGTRLGKIGREATVGGKTITEVTGLNLGELLGWIEGLDRHLSKGELQVLDPLECLTRTDL